MGIVESIYRGKGGGFGLEMDVMDDSDIWGKRRIITVT